MRLADFILSDMNAILTQWEAFATTQEHARGMSSMQLRDHAEQILRAVAADLRTAQTREEQAEKSKGRAPQDAWAPETAAETHATLRARSGFDIVELASEYRALRASVLRRWLDACRDETPHVGDVIRFNEAIDQALAESIEFFDADVERSRNLLLGMLGHDMRSPLQAILMTAAYLGTLDAGPQVSVAASRLGRSGARIQALLDDLVDFNRTNFGLGIVVHPVPSDLAVALSDEIDLQRGALPARQLDFDVRGDAQGTWDGARLQQLLGNLVQNAAKHGAPASPIRVTLDGGEHEVVLEVANRGPRIAVADPEMLFNPLQRGPAAAGDRTGASLGLGLFIAREIAKAHGGEIGVDSTADETVFTVRLPRVPANGTGAGQ